MPYAVVRTSLDPVTIRQLTGASEGSRMFTLADAVSVGRSGAGIIRDGLERGDAIELHGALERARVAAAVVDHSELPAFPKRHQFNRIDYSSQQLELHDAAGRSQIVGWGSLRLVAAGEVRATKHERRYSHGQGGDDASAPLAEVEHIEKQVETVVLALVCLDPPICYDSDAERLLYTHLGPRKQPARLANFATVIRDCAQHASAALLNRGAAALRDGVRRVVSYPSRRVFEREIIWLLWLRARGAR